MGWLIALLEAMAVMGSGPQGQYDGCVPLLEHSDTQYMSNRGAVPSRGPRQRHVSLPSLTLASGRRSGDAGRSPEAESQNAEWAVFLGTGTDQN